MKYFVFILIALILYSCCSPRTGEGIPLLSGNFRGYIGTAPEEFALNCMYKNKNIGRIFGNPDSVIVQGNGVSIANGNRISLIVEGLTTMDADFLVRVPYGEGVRFYFRASGKEFADQPKMVYEFTTQGSKLFENDKLIASVDSIKIHENYQHRIFIQNEGAIVHVIVGIDTVYQGRTNLPLTEFIYIEPIDARVHIDDVYFYELFEKPEGSDWYY
jgi:hypothetical protein